MTDLHREALALNAALAAVAAAVPTATHASLATSDQNIGYGFTLTDVSLPTGPLSTTDPAMLDRVSDEVWHLLDLDWDSAVGEDAQGYVTLPLPSLS